MPVSEKPTDDGQKRERKLQEMIGEPFKRKLLDSGGSDGVSLHIDAPLAREYDLNSETEVEVSVIEEGGDVAFRIDIPAGFTHSELEAFANNEGWELVDRYLGGDNEWSFTYHTNDNAAHISIDSDSRIDGHHVNNVVIESAGIEIESYTDYMEVSTAAFRKDLDIKFRDSEGAWQSLRSSTEHQTDDAPDEETAEQLIKNSDWVMVKLADRKTSTKTTLNEIGDIARKIDSTTNELDEKIDGSVHWLNFDIQPETPDDEQAELGEAIHDANS